MKSKWVTHRGKRIMYSDYTNFEIDLQGLQTEVNAVDDIICREPDNSVLLLVNVRNTTATVEVVELFKKSSARTTYHLRKVAVMGVSGVRRMLHDIVTRFSGQETTIFDDVDAAKDWLAEE